MLHVHARARNQDNSVRGNAERFHDRLVVRVLHQDGRRPAPEQAAGSGRKGES